MNLKVGLPATLFDHRLLVVTGKGGVGKSTIAAAFGLLNARLGKRVLLVSLREDDSLAEIFGFHNLSYQPRSIEPNLWLLNVIIEEALREYVVEKVKFEQIYKLFFENRVVQFFLEAAPGLDELLSVGKIHYMANLVSRKGGTKYDLVIVDAPATGHGLSLLKVARTAAQITRVGPIASKAGEIDAFLTDSNQTALVVVTLLEELPVTETIELLKASTDDLQMKVAAVIANKLFPSVRGVRKEEEYAALRRFMEKKRGKEVSESLFSVCDFARSWRGRQLEYLEQLRRKGGMTLSTLPLFMRDQDPVSSPRRVAEYIEGLSAEGEE